MITQHEADAIAARAEYWGRLYWATVDDDGHIAMCPAAVLHVVRGGKLVQSSFPYLLCAPKEEREALHQCLDEVIEWLGCQSFEEYIDLLGQMGAFILMRRMY